MEEPESKILCHIKVNEALILLGKTLHEANGASFLFMTLALFQPLRLFLNFFFFFCLRRLLCGLWRENSGLVSYEGPPGHLAQRLLPVSGLRFCFQARAPLLMSTALLEWWPRALVLGRWLEAGFLAFSPTLICLIYSSFCLFFCLWLILWRFPVIPLCSSSCSGGSFVRFFSARTGPHRRILFVFISLSLDSTWS